MTQRPDQLTLSLGPNKARLMVSLKQLAVALDCPGRDGTGSISQLLIHLAEMYQGAASELVAALTIAHECAMGGDWYELMDAIAPTIPDGGGERET